MSCPTSLSELVSEIRATIVTVIPFSLDASDPVRLAASRRSVRPFTPRVLPPARPPENQRTIYIELLRTNFRIPISAVTCAYAVSSKTILESEREKERLPDR